MTYKLAVIGVGNMAKSIIAGIVNSNTLVSELIVYDSFPSQYDTLPKEKGSFLYASSIADAVREADCVLLSVKPQNYDEVLTEIQAVNDHAKKLYISIGAGITAQSVSSCLGDACVIRVLPNIPMLIGEGVSIICKNEKARAEEFEFVCEVFRSSGSILLIEESEMNRMIGVTSSSPAYVFQFIQSIYQGALAQDLPDRELLDAICDVVIGTARLLKSSDDTPEEWITKVASKGGTTERALAKLKEYRFDEAIKKAMMACTARADELGELRDKK